MSMRSLELCDKIRCPKCGGTAYVVCGDHDWWTATCEECGHEESQDPTEQLDEIFPGWYGQPSRTRQLEEENERLRELAGEYAKAANYLCERWGECEYCELSGPIEQRGLRGEACTIGRLNDRATELGIEVEE